jgi:hypothetical protein
VGLSCFLPCFYREQNVHPNSGTKQATPPKQPKVEKNGGHAYRHRLLLRSGQYRLQDPDEQGLRGIRIAIDVISASFKNIG